MTLPASKRLSWARRLALATTVALLTLLGWGLHGYVAGARLSPPPGMVRIPAGPYLSGPERAPRDLPEFHLDAREVTNGEFAAFVKDSGYRPQGTWATYAGPGREQHPVVGVTWKDATCYARAHGKRLPSAWEWEKACRGTDGRLYPWGNEWKEGLANVNMRDSSPVGSFPTDVSPYGVLDMAGSVFELTDTRVILPHAPLDCTQRAVCGGSWIYTPRQADQVVHARLTASSHVIGFRCAWPP